MKKVKAMKVAIYCKTVSGSSAVAQERHLRRLCKTRGWAVSKVYVDQPSRPSRLASGKARLSLITDVLADDAKYGVVCVWHIGMLGHAIDDLLWTLDEIHVSRRIQIVAPGDDGLDTTVGDGMATKVIRALAAVGRTGT